MKKILAFALVAALSCPAIVAAQPGMQGGFNGPAYGMGGFDGPVSTVNTNTVAKALKSWDDTPVSLTGHIIQRVAGSDDKYTFRDSTGTILVDIDYELFAGRTITPQTKVHLFGEVDKEMMEPTKIDVKFFEIVQ